MVINKLLKIAPTTRYDGGLIESHVWNRDPQTGESVVTETFNLTLDAAILNVWGDDGLIQSVHRGLDTMGVDRDEYIERVVAMARQHRLSAD